MKKTLTAVYERESTLWKNANGFYQAQDWTRMECSVVDFTEEIDSIMESGIKWIEHIDGKDIDVTEREIKKRYGKPYLIKLINKRRTNEKCYWFETKEEANYFFAGVMKDKILGNFKKL